MNADSSNLVWSPLDDILFGSQVGQSGKVSAVDFAADMLQKGRAHASASPLAAPMGHKAEGWPGPDVRPAEHNRPAVVRPHRVGPGRRPGAAVPGQHLRGGHHGVRAAQRMGAALCRLFGGR